jgi:hypothetical protein
MNIDESVAGSSLGARLQTSLDSKAEHKLFEYYFRQFKPKLKERLPALIPQVYLHYDPVSIKELRYAIHKSESVFPGNVWTFYCCLLAERESYLRSTASITSAPTTTNPAWTFMPRWSQPTAILVPMSLNSRRFGKKIFEVSSGPLRVAG